MIMVYCTGMKQTHKLNFLKCWIKELQRYVVYGVGGRGSHFICEVAFFGCPLSLNPRHNNIADHELT